MTGSRHTYTWPIRSVVGNIPSPIGVIGVKIYFFDSESLYSLNIGIGIGETVLFCLLTDVIHIYLNDIGVTSVSWFFSLPQTLERPTHTYSYFNSERRSLVQQFSWSLRWQQDGKDIHHLYRLLVDNQLTNY